MTRIEQTRQENVARLDCKKSGKAIVGLCAAAVTTATAIAAVAGAIFLFLNPIILPVLIVKAVILSLALLVFAGGSLSTMMLTAQLIQQAKAQKKLATIEGPPTQVEKRIQEFDPSILRIKEINNASEMEGWTREVEPVKATPPKDVHKELAEKLKGELKKTQEEVQGLKKQLEEAKARESKLTQESENTLLELNEKLNQSEEELRVKSLELDDVMEKFKDLTTRSLNMEVQSQMKDFELNKSEKDVQMYAEKLKKSEQDVQNYAEKLKTVEEERDFFSQLSGNYEEANKKVEVPVKKDLPRQEYYGTPLKVSGKRT